ncbi:MAG: hypothetical protein LQ347_003721 [Umbilicaria vellea]|nr:MAG: hypothetical protein LQ347_003721 [Umbilicaria vellea]
MAAEAILLVVLGNAKLRDPVTLLAFRTRTGENNARLSASAAFRRGFPAFSTKPLSSSELPGPSDLELPKVEEAG